MRHRFRIRTRDRPDDRGTSVVELAMYMPILFFVILATVQIAFLFLGNQAAGSAAREAARVARNGGGGDVARQDAVKRGTQYAASVGHGLIDQVSVDVRLVNGVDGPQIEATVKGTGVRVVPGIPGVDITQVVRGPVEQFRRDPEAGP